MFAVFRLFLAWIITDTLFPDLQTSIEDCGGQQGFQENVWDSQEASPRVWEDQWLAGKKGVRYLFPVSRFPPCFASSRRFCQGGLLRSKVWRPWWRRVCVQGADADQVARDQMQVWTDQNSWTIVTFPTLRLESFYSNKYGADNLIIITDSKQVICSIKMSLESKPEVCWCKLIRWSCPSLIPTRRTSRSLLLSPTLTTMVSVTWNGVGQKNKSWPLEMAS